MVCGRLARRTTLVMLSKEKLRVETIFTLPKPLGHLFCHLVNIVFEGSVERGDELTKILCRCPNNACLALSPMQAAHSW